MKRILLVVIIIAVSGITGMAQIPGFSIGPKVGYNSNRLTTNIDSITSEPDGAFQFGGFMRIGRKTYLQPEVIYVVKGGVLNDVFHGENRSQQIELKSITIPVLVGVTPMAEKSFNFRLMAGPAFSYVSQKYVKPLDLLSSWPIRSTEDIRQMLLSLQVGAGIDLWFLTFDVRYEMGFSNIYSGNESLNVRNNLINFGLGIKFL
ncbi:MAG TPA: porin family protein [Bacteroidales bacterium]|nr:porin family protein [Bacteroidales bacterium]